MVVGQQVPVGGPGQPDRDFRESTDRDLDAVASALTRPTYAEDVAPYGNAVDRATVRQKKTAQPVRFEMTEQTREAIDDYIRAAKGHADIIRRAKKPGQHLFTGRRGCDRAITTRQYARLVGKWIASIGLDPSLFGTHSLRRTKATLIYRRTGNLRAVQLLLGHKKIESTVRYLGIEVDDALAIAEQIDV